jgi:non-canonical (house-cleaning) NTP pyrophosphatase
LNRARTALLDADYGVGIEAGIVRFPECNIKGLVPR